MDANRKKEIFDWIMKVKPDSSFAQIYGDCEEVDFVPAVELADFFYNEDMKLCSCGYARESERLLMEILSDCEAGASKLTDRVERSGTVETKALYDLVVKMLTMKGYVDHGTSVYMSHLTSKGKMYLDVLRGKFPVEQEKEG